MTPKPSPVSLKSTTTSSTTLFGAEFNSRPRSDGQPFAVCLFIPTRSMGSVAICGNFEREEGPSASSIPSEMRRPWLQNDSRAHSFRMTAFWEDSTGWTSMAGIS